MRSIESGSFHLDLFRKTLLATSGAVASVAVACSGGSESADPTMLPDTYTPTAIVSVEPTQKATATNTIEPTKAATPTPEPIKVPTLDEITEIVSSAVEPYSGNIVAQEVAGYIQYGKETFNVTDVNVVQNTTNTYGNAAKALIRLACENNDENLANAVGSLRAFSLDVVRQLENKGMYAAGATQRYEQSRFAIPAGCKNIFLSQPQKQ